MNRREHAALARQLIGKAGGLDEASRHSRLKRSRLAECADPKGHAWLPADVINDLEQYVGESIYSRALADDRPTSHAGEDLAEAAEETTEEAAAMQRMVRLLTKRGRLTPRERMEVVATALKLRADVDGVIETAEEEGDEEP